MDAAGIRLGRLASEVAALLRGKHRVTFSPHSDVGDFVIVLNSSKVVLTGDKLRKKIYYDYSGYIGGLKETSAGMMMDKHPERVIERAVKGMLPRGPLGFRLLKKLKIYKGAEHTHKAQMPETYKFKYSGA